jgi:hypothetical protein
VELVRSVTVEGSIGKQPARSTAPASMRQGESTSPVLSSPPERDRR